MTAKERDILDQLRNDVHSYHSEVKAHMATCEPYFQRVNRHSLDLYGNPEDREGNPGLMAGYADLRKGRKILLSVVAGAWTLATILVGAIASRWF